MPYANVPESKWEAMDRCVEQVMEEQKLPKERAIAICYVSIVKPKKKKGVKNMKLQKAKWDRKYINDLPDSAFAYIESGGEKDKEGKTKPRSLRHLPYKDKNGKIDKSHLRNALARLSQTHISSVAKAKARRKLVAAAKKVGIKVSEKIEKGGEKTMKKAKKEKEEKIEKKEEKVEEKVEKKEEEVEEKVEKVEEEEKVEKEEKVEEEEVEKVDEEAEEEAEDEAEDEEVEEVEKEDKEELSLSGLEERINDLDKKLEDLVELVKQASSEEESDKEEEAPEEEDSEEETSEETEEDSEEESEEKSEEEAEEAEEGAPEEEEKVEKEEKKADVSSEETSQLLEALEEIKERLTKLEKSPAPSSIVFSKAVSDGTPLASEEAQNRLGQIENRLKEIDKVRTETPDKYSGELANEAIDLVKEKKQLAGV